MITKVIVINENSIIVSFDNRTDLSITSDNGSASHIMEGLLSPRWDLTYSEYLEVVATIDEDTAIVEAA